MHSEAPPRRRGEWPLDVFSISMILTVKIPVSSLDDELKLIKQEVDALRPAIYVPLIFLRFAAEVIRAVRAGDFCEVSPAAGLDAALVSRSTALSGGRSVVSCQDMKAGIYASILNSALRADVAEAAKKIDELYSSIAEYLQKNIKQADLSKVVQHFHAARGPAFEWSAASIKKTIICEKSPCASDELSRLAGWIFEHESIHRYRLYEVMAEYLRAYDGSCSQNIY